MARDQGYSQADAFLLTAHVPSGRMGEGGERGVSLWSHISRSVGSSQADAPESIYSGSCQLTEVGLL